MTEQFIKEKRVDLDGLSQFINALTPSRNVSLSLTSCQLGKMWLGKVLQAMEVANPYPESKDPNSLKIEKTADSHHMEEPWASADTKDFNPVQKVKWLRQQLDKVSNALVWNKEYPEGYAGWKKDEEIILSLRTAREKVQEACMWLGQELANYANVPQQAS